MNGAANIRTILLFFFFVIKKIVYFCFVLLISSGGRSTMLGSGVARSKMKAKCALPWMLPP